MRKDCLTPREYEILNFFSLKASDELKKSGLAARDLDKMNPILIPNWKRCMWALFKNDPEFRKLRMRDDDILHYAQKNKPAMDFLQFGVRIILYTYKTKEAK